MSNLVSGAKDVFLGDEKKIKQPVTRFSPLQFGTPGLQTQNVPGGFTVSRTPQVSGALGQIGQQSALAGQEIGALKSLVAPGFGKLTESGVQAIQDQRSQAVSNLRENLGRRRVLGSSFGADALARTEAEFGKQEAQFRAESTLQEIQATEKLIADQFELANKGAIATIEQSNFESQIGAELSRQFTSTMSDLAKFESSLLQDAAGAQTALLSSLGSAALGGAFEGGLGKIGGALTSAGGAVSGGIDKAGDFVGGLFGGGGAVGALGAGGGGLGGALASEAIGGSLGTIGAGSTGTLSGSVGGFGQQALAGPQGAGAFGAPEAFQQIGADLGVDAATSSGAQSVVSSNPLLRNMAGGGLAGAAIGAGIAAFTGGDVAKGVASGAGAGVGAAIGSALLPGVGTLIGGWLGGEVVGKISDAIGFSGKGGGEDKADYSIVNTASGTKYNSGIGSDGPWGSVGLGHQKHIKNTNAFQGATEAITKSDEIMSALFTPEQNAAIKAEIEASGTVGQNSNEGGFSPSRMMNTVFESRANSIRKAVGDEAFNSLQLGPMYQALASGNQQAINQAFSVMKVPTGATT